MQDKNAGNDRQIIKNGQTFIVMIFLAILILVTLAAGCSLLNTIILLGMKVPQ